MAKAHGVRILRLGDQVPVDDPVETRASEGPIFQSRRSWDEPIMGVHDSGATPSSLDCVVFCLENPSINGRFRGTSLGRKPRNSRISWDVMWLKQCHKPPMTLNGLCHHLLTGEFHAGNGWVAGGLLGLSLIVTMDHEPSFPTSRTSK